MVTLGLLLKGGVALENREQAPKDRGTGGQTQGIRGPSVEGRDPCVDPGQSLQQPRPVIRLGDRRKDPASLQAVFDMIQVKGRKSRAAAFKLLDGLMISLVRVDATKDLGPYTVHSAYVVSEPLGILRQFVVSKGLGAMAVLTSGLRRANLRRSVPSRNPFHRARNGRRASSASRSSRYCGKRRNRRTSYRFCLVRIRHFHCFRWRRSRRCVASWI
ncbi:hypothetical protein AWENTII_003208 [Aspergillus wentii]